jgi:hypothetical protein
MPLQKEKSPAPNFPYFQPTKRIDQCINTIQLDSLDSLTYNIGTNFQIKEQKMSDQSNGQTQDTQATRNFNPNEHLVQLKSKAGSQDYLPVQWRLVWFRSVCPQGTIDTEEVFVDLDREVEAEAFVWNAEKRRSEKVIKQAKGYARFRAVVTDGKGGRATATGSEAAVDFPDYIEKAETKAVGRALAALGYGTQFAPEFGENHRIVDAPVDFGRNGASSNGNGHSPAASYRSEAPTNNASRPTPENEADANATEQQISSIRKLCTHLGKSEPENITSVSFLAAKKLIQQLTAEYKEQRQSSKAS